MTVLDLFDRDPEDTFSDHDDEPDPTLLALTSARIRLDLDSDEWGVFRD